MTTIREPASESAPFDTSRAHMARVYDFWLGGKDNFAADRAVAEQVAAAYPDVRAAGRGIPEDPGAIIARLVDAVVPGSYLAIYAGVGRKLLPGDAVVGEQIASR